MLGSAASSAGFTLLTFISGVVIARLLGVEGRGQYGALQYWGQLMMMLGTFSLYQGATVTIRQEGREARPLLPTLLLCGAGLMIPTVIAVVLGQKVGLIAPEGVPGDLVIGYILAMCAIAYLSRSFVALESAQLNFGTINTERLIAPTAAMLLLIPMALTTEMTLALVLLAFILGKLPVLAVRSWRYRRELRPRFDADFARKAGTLGLKFHAAQALTLISQQIDRLILVAIWPAERLGFYFVAFSAAVAGYSMVSQAVSITLLPTLAGSPPEERRDRFERLFRYTLIAAGGFAAAIIVVAPLLIPLVFGEAFRPAVAYTQGLALALAFLPLRTIVLEANRAVAKGRPGVEMAVAALAVFLVIFGATEFAEPWQLFVAIGASHIAAIAAGLRHPQMAGEFRPAHGLIPRPADAVFLVREVRRHLPL